VFFTPYKYNCSGAQLLDKGNATFQVVEINFNASLSQRLFLNSICDKYAGATSLIMDLTIVIERHTSTKRE